MKTSWTRLGLSVAIAATVAWSFGLAPAFASAQPAGLERMALASDLLARSGQLEPVLVLSVLLAAQPISRRGPSGPPPPLAARGEYSGRVRDPFLAAGLNAVPALALYGGLSAVNPQLAVASCLTAGAGDVYAGNLGTGLVVSPAASFLGWFLGVVAGGVLSIATGANKNPATAELYGTLGGLAGMSWVAFLSAKRAYAEVEYNNASYTAKASGYEETPLRWGD